MNASQSKLMDDFYELCEVMDDDISDVTIVILHMMYMGGLVLPLTCVRRDCLSATVENLEKYSDFINDALDTPIKDLRAICDKKLANTTQLRAKIKELREQLAEYSKMVKKNNIIKKERMIYKYKCPHCEKEVIIDKSMNDSERVEHCAICESELKRVWIAPTITTGDGLKIAK